MKVSIDANDLEAALRIVRLFIREHPDRVAYDVVLYKQELCKPVWLAWWTGTRRVRVVVRGEPLSELGQS